MTRRTFIQTLAAAGATSLIADAAPVSRAKFGICAGAGSSTFLRQIGYEFIEPSAQSIFFADKPTEKWSAQKLELLQSRLPILSCNGFLPGKFRLTGPEARHEEALQYAITECKRADEIGCPVLVFGSGGARNAPKGFSIEKAKEQFVAFCKKLGDAIADCQVTVILEPLQKSEANFLNLVEEGIDMVDEIAKPRIQLHADLFHMAKGGEKPDILRKAGKRVKHCHIASFEKRQWPGFEPDDLRPWFTAFRDIDYKGVFSCECGWGKREEASANQAKALQYLREQAAGIF